MIVDYTKVKKLYLVCGKTDMRKQIDGLAALVQDQFDLNPFDDCLFLVLRGKSKQIQSPSLGWRWVYSLIQVFGKRRDSMAKNTD